MASTIDAVVMLSSLAVASDATAELETLPELDPVLVEVLAPAPDVDADSSGVVSHAAVSKSTAKRLTNLVRI
jgi:hypothetical protein